MEKSFEQLLAHKLQNKYKIIGITYSNSLICDSALCRLNATFLTIQKVKKCLANGYDIYVPQTLPFIEVQENDLIINDSISALDLRKNLALNEINAKIHNIIIGISIIDVMNYLECFTLLANKGYFITDENRDEKYYEIIDNFQNVKYPSELPENATIEEENAYFEAKNKYDNMKNTIDILEKYLKTYDKLNEIKYISNMLNEVKESIESSTTEEQIDTIINSYNIKISEDFSSKSDLVLSKMMNN